MRRVAWKCNLDITSTPTVLIYPTCIWHTRSNFAEIFGVRKLESCVVDCVILRLAILVQHRLMTDGPTNT